MRSQKPAKFIQKCETVNDVIMINGWFGLKEKRVVKVRDNDLIFYSKILDVKIVVKEWYVSDGASVPQILWNIFPPFGSYLYAAIIHDVLCDLAKLGVCPIDSTMAAKVFKEAMEALGVSKWKSQPMYRAVLFLGPRWKANNNVSIGSMRDINFAALGMLSTDIPKERKDFLP
jgi:hypothetical protein